MEIGNGTQEKLLSSKSFSWGLAIFYLLVTVGIEVSLLQGIKPVWGISAYGLMLISLLALAAWSPENSPMLIGFTGIPIIRMIAFGTPFTNESLTLQLGITGLVMLFALIPIMRLTEFSPAQFLKAPANWWIQITIMVAGIGVGYLQFLVYPHGSLEFRGAFAGILFIVVLLLSAFVEELFFRGVALKGMTTEFGKVIGLVFAALLYAGLFIPFGSVGLVIVMLLTAGLYGIAVTRFGGYYGVIGAHFLSAVFYYLVLPGL